MKKRDAEKAIAKVLNDYHRSTGKLLRWINITVAADVKYIKATKITDPIDFEGWDIVYSVQLTVK